MNLLLDTNILLQLINGGDLEWGEQKWKVANFILDRVTILEVNESLINIYAEIDAFSQRRNPSYSNYPFGTPRNMGKNDLWIASTAALLGLKLVTADKDFNHLHNAFIEVQYVGPKS
ncbi:MAG TPA: PIN domain-containing protein [Mucilaginibacter sp.]